MRSPYERDGTIGATAVASFGNLQECIAAYLAGQPSVGTRSLGRFHPQSAHHRHKVARPEPSVNFRDKPGKFGRIALGQAAEDHQLADQAGFLAFSGLKDGLDGLFLGIANESAGIEQQDVNGLLHALGNYLVRLSDLGEEMLGVNCILGTSERDDLQSFIHWQDPVKAQRRPPPPLLPRRTRGKRGPSDRCTTPPPFSCARHRSDPRHSPAQPWRTRT